MTAPRVALGADALRWRASALLAGAVLVGLGVFAGVSTACAVHALILFFTDRAKLDDVYGPLSLEGQIELETGGTVAATEGKRE